MAVYDTSTFTPTITSDAKLRGWGYTSYVLLSQDSAVASLGEWGFANVQVVAWAAWERGRFEPSTARRAPASRRAARSIC